MSRRLTAIVVVVGWLIPGLLTGLINLALVPSILLQSPFWVYVAAQVGEWLIWAPLTPLIVWMVRRYPLERGRFGASAGRHALALLFCIGVYTSVSAAFSMLAQSTSLGALSAEPHLSFRRYFRGYLGIRAPICILLYAAVGALVTGIDERNRRRQRDLQAARLEAALAHAQLQALQMQLQPHFLFNTLHAISLLVTENPQLASQTITRLGDLLRHTLALVDVPEITLREELDILSQYLEIEQTRFGDRLGVAIDVPEAIRDVFVPSFILQPVVENAVRHGVAPRESPGRIVVRGRRDPTGLVLEIEDDGPGFRAEPQRRDGIGLAATRERLAVLYGTSAQLECADVATSGALVRIAIPIHDG